MVLLRLREGSDRVLVICDFLFSILCACRCPLVSLRACVMAMAAGSGSVSGRTGGLGLVPPGGGAGSSRSVVVGASDVEMTTGSSSRAVLPGRWFPGR